MAPLSFGDRRKRHPESPTDLLTKVVEHRLIPVIAINDAADAPALGRALMAGGLPVAEVTFRTAAAEKAIEAMSTIDGLLVGAGTVLSPAQVDRAIDAGARFVVSPGCSAAVVEHCMVREIPVLPGVATATDIQTALELGVQTVKFFPAETAGGAAAIKALSAPFTGVRFVPTGGINTDNLADYLTLPSVLACGGSWMVPQDKIAARDEEGLAAHIAECVRAAKEITR